MGRRQNGGNVPGIGAGHTAGQPLSRGLIRRLTTSGARR
ncbi:MAG: hypothetical protein AWU55_2891 [Halomonadaceae bacterium T82-2]|nr:MAG: hypothetical protein AWU55_2891 [Halomonadaceae bacterium T82-2]